MDIHPGSAPHTECSSSSDAQESVSEVEEVVKSPEIKHYLGLGWEWVGSGSNVPAIFSLLLYSFFQRVSDRAST